MQESTDSQVQDMASTLQKNQSAEVPVHKEINELEEALARIQALEDANQRIQALEKKIKASKANLNRMKAY